MELAGVARVRDPTPVRHIYDLHVTSAYYDATEVAQLAREIIPRDAEEFANQFQRIVRIRWKRRGAR
jgi:hypothetical protein